MSGPGPKPKNPLASLLPLVTPPFADGSAEPTVKAVAARPPKEDHEAKVKANVAKLVAKGAPEQDIHDYLEAEGYPQQSAEPPETVKENVRGALASAYQMATFGLGDKLTAATRAVLPEKLGGTKGFDYSGALKEERAGLDRFQRRHPYESAAAGAVGAIPGLVASGGASVPTLRNSIATGAKYGAMYGAGEPDSPSLEELVGSTVKGATVGGVTAGVVHAAVKTPGVVLDYAGVRPSSASPNRMGRLAQAAGVKPVEDRALETVIAKMDQAKLAPRDVSAVNREAQDLGKPLAMLDAGGQGMTRLARGAQTVPSRGADEIRSALEGRRRGAPVRVAGDVEEGFGKNRQDTFETAQKLAEQQRAKAAPIYNRAMKAGPLSLSASVPGEQLTLGEILRRPSAQKAIGYESQLAKEEGRAPFPALEAGGADAELLSKMPPEAQARFSELAKAQGVELTPTVKMEQLHNLKLRLDEMLGYAKAEGQLPDGTPATSKMLRAIQDTKNQLLSVMDAHSPDYAKARKSWAGDAELQDALEMGRDFLNGKRSPSELKSELGDFSEAGQSHLRIGVVDAVRNEIDKAPDGADVVRRIFGNEAQRQRLRVAFPDDASFNRFRRQMEIESQMAKNENMVMGNSQTAEKLSEQADMLGGIPGGGNLLTAKGIGNAILRGEAAAKLKGLARQRVDALAPYLTAGSGAPNSRSLEEVLGMIEQHQQRAVPSYRAGHATRAIAGGMAGRAVARP